MLKNRLSLKRVAFFISLLCLGLLTLNFQTNNSLTQRNFETVIDSNKFSIDVPPDWKKLTRQVQGLTAIVFMSPQVDGFYPNINVIMDSGHGVSLGEYVAHNRELMKSDGMQMDSVKNYEVNQNTAEWFNVTYSYMGHALAIESYIFLKDNVAYIITCTCLDTQKSEYNIIFNNALKTFKILN